MERYTVHHECLIPYEHGNVVLYADAQATVEALQAIIKQMGEQACVLAKDGMAAKAQVEALQRERDHAKNMAAVQKEVADNQTWHVRELRTALDAERDRLRAALQAFCDEVEMDAAAMAYKCDLGAGEWEAFIDRTKLYKQYLAGKSALTPAGGG